jgi:hypothetical protein
VLIGGLAAPFEHGEYIFSYRAGDGFPTKPPERLRSHTLNGVFTGAPGGSDNICISIGQYHPENWRAGLGLAGFGTSLVSSLVGYEVLDHGLGITILPKKKETLRWTALAATIRQHAAGSHAYNLKHHFRLMTRFAEHAAAHPGHPPCAAALARWRGTNSRLLAGIAPAAPVPAASVVPGMPAAPVPAASVVPGMPAEAPAVPAASLAPAEAPAVPAEAPVVPAASLAPAEAPSLLDELLG